MDVGSAVLDDDVRIAKRSLYVDLPVGCKCVAVGAVVRLYLQIAAAGTEGIAADP